MKRLIVAVVYCLFGVSMLCAQTITTSFKGHPIDGSLSSFVAALKADGFEDLPGASSLNNSEQYILKGDFAGINDATIMILASPYTRKVWRVAVLSDSYTSWSSIKSDYLKFRNMFSSKYGEPRKYEFFSDPYYEGDGYEMSAIGLDKCNYCAYWQKMDAGEYRYSVSITKSKSISIIYTSENCEEHFNRKKSAAYDDI